MPQRLKKRIHVERKRIFFFEILNNKREKMLFHLNRQSQNYLVNIENVMSV